MNRSIIPIILVVILISSYVPASYADTIVGIEDTRCHERLDCDVTQASADVQLLLDSLGIPSGSESIAQLFAIAPDPTVESVELTFKVERDTGTFEYSFGFCDSDDVSADPISQKQQFAEECLANATELFDDTNDDVGDVQVVTVAPGQILVFYLIPNNDLATFNSDPDQFFPPQTDDNAFRAPLFSVEDANPGEFDQMLSFIGAGVTLFTFEDLSRTDVVPPGASDEDFTDLAFSINVEFIPKPFCELFPDVPACTLVGGDLSNIDTVGLLVAGATSLSAFYLYGFSALAIGSLWFTLNPYNRRNIKTILQDYFDRL